MRYKLDNTKITFKNFSGAKSQYNAEGKRNFHVLFNDTAEAERFHRLGFNVKFPAVSERILEDPNKDPDSYRPLPHMKVNVNIDSKYPPKIVLVEVQGETDEVVSTKRLTTSEEIASLDYTNIKYCDIEISDYNYGDGVSAYAQTIYAICPVDDYMSKYGI